MIVDPANRLPGSSRSEQLCREGWPGVAAWQAGAVPGVQPGTSSRAGLAVRTRLSLWHKSIVRGRPEAKPRAEICGSARCSARHSCSLDQAGTRGWELSFVVSTSQVRWGRWLLSGTALFTAARSKVGSQVWCIRAGCRYRQPQPEE